MPLALLLDPRVRRALLVLWCGLWAWVLYESLVPVRLPEGVSDKSVHLVGYALMVAGAAGFCHEPRRLALLAAGAAAAGGLIELAQLLTPTRSCELADFLADAAGAALGWLAALAWLALVIGPLRRRRHRGVTVPA